MRAPLTALGLALAAASAAPTGAAAAPVDAARSSGEAARAGLGLQLVGRFREPVYVTSPPGDPRTLAVVERRGRVRLVRRGRVLRRPLADLRRRVRIDDPNETVDQRGLLSLAFAPGYRRTGRFYVFYIGRGGRARVDELRRGRRRVRRVLDLGPVGTQHHGGQLQFGPDGRLYVSTGMDADPAVSQDPAHPGGKLLRLNPRARRPRAEVYALGLRNPWRFSFDRRTGALLIGDVGEAAVEEVDLLPAGAPPGANFGWPGYEGRHRRAGHPAPAGARPPALAHPHAQGWCAITGGYVVRDRRLPALRGRYLYGDLCSGRLWSARLRGRRLGRARPLAQRVPYVVSFGEDAAGRVYAVSFFGPVYRLIRRP